ncbi:hypothetical protein B0H16DRAFT_1610763 [Mycena metata]|uniref:Zn(2)-C6 fungal-type domain-containing protein n=1 Tax=Mycena metata TaxID=1033252 RepID=A0AAD7MHD1_9AGAR|nr:hypothetical protein B0H16DRAFT_1610763 [Mycena metata]
MSASRKQLKSNKQAPTSRKKSCLSCSEAKARCTLERPNCSRCQGRDLVCEYFTPASHSISDDSPLVDDPAVLETASGRSTFTTLETPPTSESVQIGSRWLDALITPPGKIPKHFSSRTVQHMSRVLKSYAKVLLKDEALPPIVHPFQAVAPQQPLANCRSLLRTWENKAPGSELLVRETIWREMSRLVEEHHGYDHVTLLSAFQAYLFYSIHLFFSTDPESSVMIDTATMINLQELAAAMSLTGLHPPDTQHTRPTWESWIIAEAKRRTLYTMYLFDNARNFLHDTTSYIATELGNLPLPAGKGLWAASIKETWEIEYNRFVAEWPSGPPRLEDLWPHPSAVVASERRTRVDRWVETADEFGIFLFAVSSMHDA